jgi:hypothetical protein
MIQNKTKNLEITYMSQSQAGKEMVFNDAITTLDASKGCLMNDEVTGDNAPPSNALFGLYFVGSNPSGDWENQNGHLAYYAEGWKFIKPFEGMLLFQKKSKKICVFCDGSWIKL